MKNIIIMLCIFSPLNLFAQWQWSRHMGGNTFNVPNDRIQSLSSDENYLYISGFYGGNFYMPGDTLPANGSTECFVAKFDQNGNQIWAANFGGPYNGISGGEYSIGKFDNISQSLYMSGVVIDIAQFGTITSPGSWSQWEDIFLARMNTNGTFVWVKRSNSIGTDHSNIEINSNGLIYLISNTSDSLHFDSIHLPQGGNLLIYDSLGVNQYASPLYNSYPEVYNYFSNIRLKFINSDMVLFGSFLADTFYLDTTTFANAGADDIFVARTDSVGNVKWANQYGNGGVESLYALDIDDQNYLYLMGGYSDSINFNGTSLYDTGADLFIAKLDSAGNHVWSRSLSCTGTTMAGYDLICDDDGQFYITGEFSGTATFDSYQITAGTSSDMFLARYDAGGNCVGVKHFGQAYGVGLATDSNDNVYVAGGFTGTVNIGSSTFTSYGGIDAFLAKADAITGIEEERTGQEQLLIYANPSRGTCQVSIPESLQQEKNLILRLYDNKGTLIEQQEVQMKQGTLKLSLNAQAKGMYHVTLGNGKKQYSGKVVFE